MEPLGLAELLRDQFPDEVLDIILHRGQAGVVVRRERIVDLLRWLQDDETCRMNHLLSLCGVDNAKRLHPPLERFEVVYNLYSIEHRHQLRLRAQVPGDDPLIDSVTSLWCGADWLERETWDLCGISFNNHPNLKRVLLPEDWVGHPLRKEYPLKGDREWQGLEDLLARSQALRGYDFGGDGTLPLNEAGKSRSSEAGER
ncbi:MAG: NADH dehydrogenase [Desulfobulbaceae bacterium A2]|nr:MAG: NADH dehydrogenase [Desulfobulbaceae bacterium A2]